jgi:enoyl-[acyl-carrier-protein] reductase (NADH)
VDGSTPELIDVIITGALIPVILGIGKLASKWIEVAITRMERATERQTVQIVTRLDAIEHRQDATDAKVDAVADQVEEIRGKVNGVAHAVGSDEENGDQHA